MVSKQEGSEVERSFGFDLVCGHDMLRKVHLSQQWLVRLEDLEDRLVKAEESVQHADGFDAIISVLLD